MKKAESVSTVLYSRGFQPVGRAPPGGAPAPVKGGASIN